MAVIAVLVPFAQIAQANHGSRTLEVNPEQQTRDPDATGDEAGTAVLTAQISSAPTFSTGAINIDFEMESGPNEPEANGDSPLFPDKSCSIPVGQTTCFISYDGEVTGVDQWRVWIDHDGDNSTVEADPDEGRDEEIMPGTPSTLLTQCRANQTEPDCTDVVEVKWTGLRMPGSIDCDDSGGPNTERETNRSGGGSSSNETYTCHVFDENGQPLVDQDPDEPEDQPTTVYGEHEGTPNDPDEDNSTSYSTPDYQCTTTPGDFVNGQEVLAGDNNCTISVTQAELEVGTTTICFWAVGDGDNSVAEAGQRHCVTLGEPIDENQKADGSDTPNDLGDRTELTWEVGVPTSVDVETESETLTLGETRTLTATVYDQFGVQLAGDTVVNFEFFKGSPTDKTDASADGNSPGSPDMSCETDDGPDCTEEYTQATTAGRDLICAWIGSAPSMEGTSRNGAGECDGEKLNDADDAPGADAPEPRNDDVDVVETTWLNENPATKLDCVPENSRGVVRSSHKVTCTATADDDSPVANTEIDVELTGANDKNGNTPGRPDRRCTTNAEGECSFRHGGRAAKKAGKTTYRAWIDADYHDETVEADMEEERDEEKAAGATEEPDNTDVVQRVWLSGDRKVTLNANDRQVNRGAKVTFFGDVDADASDCEDGVVVNLQKRRRDGSFAKIDSETTDNNGNFSFKPVRVFRDTVFRANAPRDGACENAKSSHEQIRTN